MKELLLKHKAEVARLIISEFDEAEYMRLLEKEKEEEIAVYKEQLSKKMCSYCKKMDSYPKGINSWKSID